MLYALMGLILIPFLLLAAAFALGLPIVYGVLGFVVTAIACAACNFLAGLVRGIEVELESGQAKS